MVTLSWQQDGRVCPVGARKYPNACVMATCRSGISQRLALPTSRHFDHHSQNEERRRWPAACLGSPWSPTWQYSCVVNSWISKIDFTRAVFFLFVKIVIIFIPNAAQQVAWPFLIGTSNVCAGNEERARICASGPANNSNNIYSFWLTAANFLNKLQPCILIGSTFLGFSNLLYWGTAWFW